MANKPTDAEIIKALECCTSDKCTCLQCPYEDSKHIIGEEFEVMPNGKTYDVWCCDEWLKVDLLDLINRLKAENERLQKYNTDVAYKHYNDGIKEFAERLKEDISWHRTEMYMNGLKGTPRTNEITYGTVEEYIDNLVKEMVGDSE